MDPAIGGAVEIIWFARKSVSRGRAAYAKVIPMNREYSDSLFLFGIGASFIITLLALLLVGSLAGVFLGPFLAQKGFEQ